jgi:hypothetical protein
MKIIFGNYFGLVSNGKGGPNGTGLNFKDFNDLYLIPRQDVLQNIFSNVLRFDDKLSDFLSSEFLVESKIFYKPLNG